MLFGIARKYNEANGYRSRSYIPSGSAGYVAPEMFGLDERTGLCLYTSASDIYALGMLLLCLGSDNLSDPYPILTENEKLTANKQHVMPRIGQEVSSFTHNMLLACFKRNPNQRIDAETLLSNYNEQLERCKESSKKSKSII